MKVTGRITAIVNGCTDVTFPSSELGVAVGDRVVVEIMEPRSNRDRFDGDTVVANVIAPDRARAVALQPGHRVGASCIVRLPRTT